MSKALSEQQKRFVDNWLESNNITDAYKRAGYKPKSDASAASSGSLLLRNPKVEEYISVKRQELESRRFLTKEKIREKRRDMVEDDEVENNVKRALMADECQMMGYNEAEKVDAELTINVVKNW